MFVTKRLKIALATSVGAGAAALGAVALAETFTAHADAVVRTTARPSTIPISSRDRVYTADQTSNTVSVIDPSTDRTLGTIALGAQRLSNVLNPQYLDDAGVHGLAFSRDHQRLGVVSIASNTVDIIDTATNKVLNHTDVGRASHEGSFTADGREFWVADRGRDTVTVVDAVHGGVLANLPVGAGPSKVVMSPDGKYAYVNHISLPEITVVDVASRKVVDHITGLGDAFSSDEAISPDGKELWVPHKRAGKTSVVDLVQRKVVAVLTTGPDTNHPNFADTPTGSYAYLTVGGLDETLVYRRTGGAPAILTRIHDHGHAPHGIWQSGDFTRMYVGLEKSDAVDVIDTTTNKVIDTIQTGQEPQALVYVPDAAPDGGAPNLGRQGLDQQAHNVSTVLPDGSPGQTLDPVNGRHLEATIRPVNGLDMIGLQARGLKATTTYQAYSVAADGRRTPLVSFSTDANGNAPQVLAFSAFDGSRIAIAAKGAAPPAQATSLRSDDMHGGTPGAVTTADLLYCDCC